MGFVKLYAKDGSPVSLSIAGAACEASGDGGVLVPEKDAAMACAVFGLAPERPASLAKVEVAPPPPPAPVPEPEPVVEEKPLAFEAEAPRKKKG
jgi:hypothetical protein